MKARELEAESFIQQLLGTTDDPVRRRALEEKLRSVSHDELMRIRGEGQMGFTAELIKQERASGQPTDLMMLVQSTECFWCRKSNATSYCSGCLSILYCSRECQTKSWKLPLKQPSKPDWIIMTECPHKKLCKRLKLHTEDGKAFFSSASRLFPWLIVVPDKFFSTPHDLILARQDVWGPDTGFWSRAVSLTPHVYATVRSTPSPEHLQVVGKLLLQSEWPSWKDGWHLRNEPHIPTFRPIAAPPLSTLTSWTDYIEWRQLPRESVAPLLLSFPLSLYSAIASFPHLMHQRKLVVHIVGVERELNCIPVLADELRNVLPESVRDVELRMFGPSVCDVARRSLGTNDAALINRDIVFSYKTKSGAGVSVSLETKVPLWQDAIRKLDALPHLIFAFNAGLGTYSEWADVMHFALSCDIPMACTEYTEYHLDMVTWGKLLLLMQDINKQRAVSDKPLIESTKRCVAMSRCPFFVPGGRVQGAACTFPNHVNGYMYFLDAAFRMTNVLAPIDSWEIPP